MHRWRKGRLGVWLRRYLPAEAVGTLTAVASASVASALGSSVPLAVYVAALGENLGYYATMFAREFVTQMRTRESSRVASAYTTVKSLLLEFGPAEVLDSA